MKFDIIYIEKHPEFLPYKYEYVTVEDLGEKPEPIKQAKFEYSSFGENLKKQIKTIKE